MRDVSELVGKGQARVAIPERIPRPQKHINLIAHPPAADDLIHAAYQPGLSPMDKAGGKVSLLKTLAGYTFGMQLFRL